MKIELTPHDVAFPLVYAMGQLLKKVEVKRFTGLQYIRVDNKHITATDGLMLIRDVMRPPFSFDELGFYKVVRLTQKQVTLVKVDETYLTYPDTDGLIRKYAVEDGDFDGVTCGMAAVDLFSIANDGACIHPEYLEILHGLNCNVEYFVWGNLKPVYFKNGTIEALISTIIP